MKKLRKTYNHNNFLIMSLLAWSSGKTKEHLKTISQNHLLMFPLHFAIVPSARLCRPSRYSGNTLNEDPPNTHQTQSNKSRNTITKTPPKNNPANNQINKNNQASQQTSKPATQPASQQASQQARNLWLAGGVSRCEYNMKTFLFFTACAKHLHNIA